MLKCLQIIGLMLGVSLGSFAQTLRLDLPYYKDKKVVLVQRQGVRNDTVAVATLDAMGKASLLTNKALQVGLGAILIDKEVQYPFVLSPSENALIIAKNEAFQIQNTKIENSIENAALARWGMKTMVLSAKIMGIENLLPLYNKEQNVLTKALSKEKTDLVKELTTLSDSLKKSNLFAAKYLKNRSLLENIIKHSTESDTLAKATRQALLQEIDLPTLHGSDMWFEVLNHSLEIYTKEGKYYEKFGEDMVSLMKKTSQNQIVADLAEAAVSICAKYAWNKDQDVIVDYLRVSNRIQKPRGGLKKMIEMQATAIGKQAPDLVLTQHIGKTEEHNHKTTVLKSTELSTSRSLVIFYQSGCGHCETTMNGLRDNYAALSKNGLRIIAISADMDEQVFKNTAASYPWQDSYCDLEGLQGVNFKSYAVLGTPSLYILDSKGIIKAKVATIEEVLDFVKKN